VLPEVERAGERGKPAKVTLTANGTKVGEGRFDQTVPLQFSLGEGIELGMDSGSAVDVSNDLPFAFTGMIHKVTVTRSADAHRAGWRRAPAFPDEVRALAAQGRCRGSVIRVSVPVFAATLAAAWQDPEKPARHPRAMLRSDRSTARGAG
jgi:hypothetical protein